jgi:hypothetical protein
MREYFLIVSTVVLILIAVIQINIRDAKIKRLEYRISIMRSLCESLTTPECKFFNYITKDKIK